jgi:hypothetical protein
MISNQNWSIRAGGGDVLSAWLVVFMAVVAMSVVLAFAGPQW